MRIEFENSKGERRKIGEAVTIQGCLKIMHKFLDDHNYKSYYQRFSETEDGSIWIDVGSHTEFFWIVDENKKLTMKDFEVRE